MPNEFLSSYQFLQLTDNQQRQGIDFLLGKDRPPEGLPQLDHVTDPLARLELLAQALLTPYKDYARAGSRREGGGLPQLYASPQFQQALEARRQQMAALGLLPSLPNLRSLPAFSFALHFTFTLRTPYISKDDAGLHILDNPVRKDKVFGLPMAGPAAWKGSLRAAIRQANGWGDEQAELRRLFGEARGDEGQSGHLYFYPTFFVRLGLEVINPHDRQSNAGKQPIYFECVPAGAPGDFTLLYVPDGEVGRDEALADLELTGAGVRALFTSYGFGAKTSSGYGLAQTRVSAGTLVLRVAGLQPAAASSPEAPAAPAPNLPRYLEAPGRLMPEYRTSDGGFRERGEAELKIMKKADRQLYDKAKAWWAREGKAPAASPAAPGAETPAIPAAPGPTWPSWPFATFDELTAVTQQAAQQAQNGGAQ